MSLQSKEKLSFQNVTFQISVWVLYAWYLAKNTIHKILVWQLFSWEHPLWVMRWVLPRRHWGYQVVSICDSPLSFSLSVLLCSFVVNFSCFSGKFSSFPYLSFLRFLDGIKKWSGGQFDWSHQLFLFCCCVKNGWIPGMLNGRTLLFFTWQQNRNAY